jgi:hypothetical protein
LAEVGDIIEVKDFQSLTNIEGDILNVYHFEVTSVTGTPVINNDGAAWVAWFYGDFILPILQVQNTALSHQRIEVNNLMDYTTEFGVFNPTTASLGQVTGNYSSAAIAWSFELVRLFRTTRNGSKRIAGVPEALVDNNVAAGTAPTNLQAVANMLESAQFVMNTGGTVGLSMRPVIIRKPPTVGVPPTVVNPVANVLYRGVGSQNSRKQLL